MDTDANRTGHYLRLTTLILLAAFWVRVWHLDRASLWADEVYTFRWVQDTLGQTIDQTLQDGVHTPLYFVSLHVLPVSDELSLRFSAVLTGVLGVGLLMFVVRRLYGNSTQSLWAGALLAANPFHVWLSRMARPYSLLLVFALLSSYTFLQLLRGQRSRGHWAIFVLSSAAAYMTHYFGLMLPLAQYVVFAFVLRNNRHTFRCWIGAQLLASIPLLGWIIASVKSGAISLGIAWIPQPGPGDLVKTLQNMTIGFDGSPDRCLVPGFLVAMAGLVLGVFRAVRRTGQRRDPTMLYWAWLVIAPLSVVFLVSQRRPLYVDRYFVEIIPGLLILISVGLTRIAGKKWGNALMAIVVFSFALSVTVSLARGDDEREGWRAAALTVRQNVQLGDGLLVQSTAVLNAFSHYYGYDAMHQLEVYGITDADEGIHLVGEITPHRIRRIWAVFGESHDGHRLGPMPSPDPFVCTASPVTSWLVPRRAQMLDHYEFNGLTLVLVDVSDDLYLTSTKCSCD